MAKNKNDTNNFPLQPDELNALTTIAKEYIDRAKNIDNEIELLREDRRHLREEFTEKLDVKTLEKAMKLVKLESDVDRRDTFDCFVELLKRVDTQ